MIIACMVGVQDLFKKSEELGKGEISWLKLADIFCDMMKKNKLQRISNQASCLLQFFDSVTGVFNVEDVFSDSQSYVRVCGSYLHVAQSLANISMLGLLNLNKFLSVIIKVFSEIMTNGFCPIKDLDDGPSMTSNEFKSSEEESGLGQGEGAKDVSDQIENEDMLDGAYQNQEDANDNEEKDNKEEENGIEMSENFESNLQDKEDQKDESDQEDGDYENKELDDEKGEVQEDEELDKEMWGDEDEEDKSEELEDGDKGNSAEEKMDDLSAKEDHDKSEEKRERKKEEEQDPEFDDDQTDNQYGDDKQYPEPEAFDLPENMDLDETEQEENFEEPDTQDPEVQPDFADESDDNENEDEEEKDTGNPDVETFDDVEENTENENNTNNDVEQSKEDDDNTEMEVDQEVENTKETESGMDVDDSSDQKAVDAAQNQEQSKDEQSSDGLNSEETSSKSKDSFGVVSEEKEMEKDEAEGAGNSSECDKTLADINTDKPEKLDIVEGEAVENSEMGEASIFQHVKNEKDSDRTAIDKADEKEMKEQVIPENFEEEKKDSTDLPQMKEEHEEKKDRIHESQSKQKSVDDPSQEEHKKIETEGEVVSTYNVSRGNDSFISSGVEQSGASFTSVDASDHSLSLETIQLSDRNDVDTPVVTPLSHQLCEQLRLVLEPTKASKLQGDFKTGKRLNMRKIIPYIASQFKKDKIWLRRVKPNKREFQILVALDDSSSMCDNQSREMALSSLNTISSALSLLEVGQLGVLRFGKNAEVVHGLGTQWSQSAGAKIQNQFTFEQGETSLLSLLSLSTQLFVKSSASRSRNLDISQLLVIVSDGRGVFHEGREKVMRAVRQARQAGYFSLFLIVENPSAKDSVLDVRLPVFSAGKLVSIDSYMDHFPFSHYIVLRDVHNLPRTLSDALRQWFELVIS